MIAAVSPELAAISIRLEPGEEICAGLAHQLDALGIGGAALVSAAGSVRDVKYALVVLKEGGEVAYGPRRLVSGASEIVSLSGHMGKDRDRTWRCHLHGAIARADGQLVGGHIFEAWVLATIEITLLGGESTSWEAEKVPGFEAADEGWILTPVSAVAPDRATTKDVPH